MGMNRHTIYSQIIFILNEQDNFSMSYNKLTLLFQEAGANFDVAISRMEGKELRIYHGIVTLNEEFRHRRRGVVV